MNLSPRHQAARPAVTSSMSLCSQIVPLAGGSYHVAWLAAGANSSDSVVSACCEVFAVTAGGDLTGSLQGETLNLGNVSNTFSSCVSQLAYFSGRPLGVDVAWVGTKMCKTLNQHYVRAWINKWIYVDSAALACPLAFQFLWFVVTLEACC